DVGALDEERSQLALETDLGLDEFARREGGRWSAQIDRRTGLVANLEGSGLAWFPGRGNSLQADDVRGFLGGKPVADLAAHDRRARAFLPEVADLLGIDARELRLDQGRSGSPAAHVWFVDYDVTRGGVPVEGARVVLAVNNGNLVSIATENLPRPGARTPRLRINAARALRVVEEHVGGFYSDDQFADRGSYHLLPANVLDLRYDEGYERGRGRELAGVWQIVFHRPGEPGTFRARVDAESGELLDFLDVNEYGAVTGGVYQTDKPATERVLPMPFANVASGVYANSAGIFSGTTGTTTLDGQYVKVTDSCGSISKAADGSGTIALGSSAGTDCTTPGSGGAGNTHSARTQFYALNRAKEVARGWLPSNTWINAKLTANVNLNQTCNAYWNGSTVNFFRSGGGCANTGELPGISLHEYGHGLDTNDGSGSSPDNGTGETYGDFTAALATHGSCVGAGFLGSNCPGYGNACTSCTGVRDIDWAKHSRNTASTVENFTRPTCPQPSANNPNYVGPCGKDAIARGTSTKKREGHCESYVSSEALWDLANRDMTSPGSGAAWTVVDRLWYLSRSTASGAFSCNVSATAWTSNGCNTGSLFKIFRTVDDDNGNLADGTPHGGAIAAAMNRHAIACTTDAGWNTTFAAVAPPAVPTLTATAGSNSAALSWSGSTGVYDVYRNETGCNAGFTRIRNDNTTTSYSDTAVANGLTYYYQVVAHPSGNEAAASAPSICKSVTPTGGTCTPPAAPTGLSATAVSSSQINLSWTASSGATSYTILRSTTSGGPYSSVGTSATTSFSNTGLAASTTYYYVVQASNGTCSSGNSAQASATTQAGSGSVLSNGVPVTGISGGTGDADMYVRFGSAPTTTTYDCRPYLNGNNETCTFATPSVGTYYVMLRGYTAYSGVTLTGSYSSACTPPAAPTGLTATAVSSSQINLSWTASSGATSYGILRSTTSGGPYSSVGTSSTTSFSNTGLAASTTYHYVVSASNGSCSSGNSAQVSATTQGGGGSVLSNGVPVTGISGATGSQQTWTMSVPAGASNLQFTISGGTGDADLYVRFGAAPTTSTYDCRPYLSGNSETCTFATPSTGTYYVMLNAYAAFSGVTLTGSYSTGGGATELITNGGFEGSSSPWVRSGNAYWTGTGSYPHSGTGYSYLGNVNNASGTEYQAITIPSAASTAQLTFWLNTVSSETTTTTQYDKLFVEVRNTSGTLLATLATYSNLNKTTAGNYSQKSFSLLAYKGQTVRVQFRGTTDGSLITTFRVDDVSVK
ncbi:MAG TPA: pre-peptidase C-terminal domain-containing protein, partial [Thermoanaerobaculia bacterium]|nr:pre-peptidase C-terminal domain-containing protein [Thermoanaerobaculia bacterium]